MSKKTPKRASANANPGYSPISLPVSPAAQSPHKNLTGPPRVIRDIIADLYNNIQRWNSLHIKGCAIVKQVASLKADDPRNYSTQLEELVNELYIIVEGLKLNDQVFAMLVGQGEAFSKLPNPSETVFFSSSAEGIVQLIRDICGAYDKEFKAKQFVLENIAHCKNKNEAMFLAAYWTHQLNISEKITFKLESLLVESGHRAVQ